MISPPIVSSQGYLWDTPFADRNIGTPTLLYTGQASPSPIVPYRFSAYYENIQDAEIAFPDNMKLVTGKATATTAAETDPSTDAQWFCEGSEPAADKVSFPTSTCATHLQHLLYFPDCVNPTTLAYTFSGTQNWNATFKPANRCPSDMKRIPRLRFSIRYDLRKIISKGWSGAPPLELSSGNSFSSHGDFFNGWNPTAATNMLAATGTSFLGISGPLGGPYDGGKCTAKDADPTHGTSDYETSVKLQSKRSVMIEREFVA